MKLAGLESNKEKKRREGGGKTEGKERKIDERHCGQCGGGVNFFSPQKRHRNIFFFFFFFF